MAFEPKKREEFLNSLKHISMNKSEEKNMIDNFNPITLSDLYELFLKLKDFVIDDKDFEKLSTLISSQYPRDIFTILHNPITDMEIQQLLDIMQQEYTESITYHNPKNISEKELEHLKEILHTERPSMFLDFIEKSINNQDFAQQTKLIKDTVSQLADAYYDQASPNGQKNLDYLTSAIYLIYKKLQPGLSIIIPSRIKGLKSFDDNATKELNNAIQDTIPYNIQTGIDFSDLQKHISSNDDTKNFADKTIADLSGITIVLNHIDETLHFDNLSENSEILNLRKQRNDNLKFLHSMKKYLNENDIFMTQEEYFQAYIELLDRLQDSTYPECTHEIKGGNYSSRLKLAINNYKKLALTDSFSANATSEEIDELYTLTDCLARRVDDKLENEILLVTFPQILDDPLLTDDFKISGKFIKFVKKENGFCAIYFELTDAMGRKTEVQLQSNMRYNETKNGPSTHNDMPNKKVDIRHFFELTNNRDNPKELDSYLTLLSRTSKRMEEELKNDLANLEEEKNIPTKTPADKRNLTTRIERLKMKIQNIENAKNNIQVKEHFREEYDMIDTKNTFKEDNSEILYVNGRPIKVFNTKTTKRVEEMDIEQYLPIYAEYYSPVTMKTISSAHATAPEAYVNSKDLIESFSEILRKGDEIPYLAEMLLDKLKAILQKKNTNQISYEDLKNYAAQNFYKTPSEDSEGPDISR